MPNIHAINKTDNNIIVDSWTVYYINKTNAQTVTVYDQNNNQFNAFQFNLDERPWWYVLDDIQNRWVNDLSSIGYHISVPVVLPTVTLDAGWCSISPNHAPFLSDNTQRAVYWVGYWSSWLYDSSKSYAAWWWRSESESAYYGTVLSDNGDGCFGITNVLGRTIGLYIESRYSTCESPDAVAIQVLNSSNVAYAAFKYTQNGVDYYYVLDEVQTDWTDDLSSIGYVNAFPIELIVAMSLDSSGNPVAVTFDYPQGDNYWTAYVRNSSDKDLLNLRGLWYAKQPYTYGLVKKDAEYNYEVVEIYTGVGEGVAPFDLSYFTVGGTNAVILECTSSYSTPVKSWKLRITKL